jgi:hypothetical protein
MKPLGLISMVVLFFLGTIPTSYAKQGQQQQQQQQQQEDKQRKQEQKAKPEKQQEAKQEEGQAKGQQEQEKKHQQEKKQQQENKSTRQEQQQAAKPPKPANQPSQQQQNGQQGEQQAAWQGHRAHDWKSEHRDWQQRGGYNGYRIPEDRYRGYFGPSHTFRISSYPVVAVGGYPRFQYGGFWLSVVDPWPEYWSNDWYDNDDVYIEYYGDGYYLYNRRYPQDQIAVMVSVN